MRPVLKRGPRPGLRRVASIVAAGLVLAMLARPVTSLAEPECGKERWDVKIGTDPNADLVDLAHPQTTTVADLVSRPKPLHWGNDLPRQDGVEKTVFVITAFLTAYAPEEDSDYHLAVEDEHDRSMIVEVPAPSCVGSQSPFLVGIQHARDQFESARGGLDAKLHREGHFKVADSPIPVRITGVGFFDKLHGQRGLAPNGIELHPVLDIEFDPTPRTTELLADGGFEAAISQPTGPSAPAWNGSTNLATHPLFQANGSARTGESCARLGERNGAVDSVSQTVTIPEGAKTARLSFWVNVVTHESPGAGPDDLLSVEVRAPTGALLRTLLTLSNRDSGLSDNSLGTYFEGEPSDVSAFAGQTVQVVFRATTDTELTTAFRIDDVSLTASLPRAAVDDLPPAAAVTGPADGQDVSGTVPVTADSSGGAIRTEIHVDGTLRASSPEKMVAFDWDTTLETNGPHAIVATAFDGEGHVWPSATVTVTVSNAPPVQLLEDPGFESGAAAGSPWTASPGVVVRSSQRAPHSGSWYGWVDGYGRAHTDAVWQAVAVPASAASARLSFWLHIDTAETGDAPADTLRVEIRSLTGIVLSRLITYTNLGSAEGFGQKVFDLSSFRGQTIQVALTGTEDGARQTSFVLDDFTLVAR